MPISHEAAVARGLKAKGTVLERRGADHYSRIGKLGGKAVSQDREHMSEIGRKGRESITPEQRTEGGRKGGLKRAENRETMAEIGRLGGLAKAAKRNASSS